MPTKPTGHVGPLALENKAGEIHHGWKKIAFPKDKEEIEELMMKGFAAVWRKHTGIEIKYKQNPQNEIDFTILEPGGPALIELREVLYRDDEGRPYDSRNIKIMASTFAQQIVDAVQEKSKHYGPQGMPVDLLLYTTHWRFDPAETVIRLVQHSLKTNVTIFENIFLLMPIDGQEWRMAVLSPSKEDPLEGHSPDEFKDHWYLVLDPDNWELHGDHAVQP
jgi:hypothetical protein